MKRALKVAFSHDWLNGMRGGEKCLELIADLYPESPIYTLFYEKGRVSPRIASHPVRSSWLGRLPNVYRWYRYYLPFYQAAIESLGAPDADLVISMNHCVAKGINKKKRAVHICYCFTPVRYAWGLFDDYFGSMNPIARALIGAFMKRLKWWDYDSARRVDIFVAISQHIRKRIMRCYGRESEVIYPPVNTRYYEPDHRLEREDFYLVVSALVPYKRIDVAVRAARAQGKRLVVIGEGPERSRLEKMAGEGTVFLGWQPDEVLRDHYRRCKALLFPGEEDFGIVPVEVQACGGFVLAFAEGGALETVMDGETGLFFSKKDPSSLAEAMRRFESMSWDADAPRKNALRFSEERFIMEFKSLIQRHVRTEKTR